MNAERIDEFAKEVWDFVWLLLDCEIDTDAEMCGKVATAAEKAARAELERQFS